MGSRTASSDRSHEWRAYQVIFTTGICTSCLDSQRASHLCCHRHPGNGPVFLPFDPSSQTQMNLFSHYMSNGKNTCHLGHHFQCFHSSQRFCARWPLHSGLVSCNGLKYSRKPFICPLRYLRCSQGHKDDCSWRDRYRTLDARGHPRYVPRKFHRAELCASIHIRQFQRSRPELLPIWSACGPCFRFNSKFRSIRCSVLSAFISQIRIPYGVVLRYDKTRSGITFICSRYASVSDGRLLLRHGSIRWLNNMLMTSAAAKESARD